MTGVQTCALPILFDGVDERFDERGAERVGFGGSIERQPRDVSRVTAQQFIVHATDDYAASVARTSAERSHRFGSDVEE